MYRYKSTKCNAIHNLKISIADSYFISKVSSHYSRMELSIINKHDMSTIYPHKTVKFCIRKILYIPLESS